MFFAGKGKGGLQFAFGVAATIATFAGLHVVAAGALKTAGMEWYTKLIGVPSDWASEKLKCIFNMGAKALGKEPMFPEAADTLVPPEAASFLSNVTRPIGNLLGMDSGPLVPPVPSFDLS